MIAFGKPIRPPVVLQNMLQAALGPIFTMQYSKYRIMVSTLEGHFPTCAPSHYPNYSLVKQMACPVCSASFSRIWHLIIHVNLIHDQYISTFYTNVKGNKITAVIKAVSPSIPKICIADVLAQQKDGDNAKLACLLMDILVEHEIPIKSPILKEKKEFYNMPTSEIKQVKEENIPESDNEDLLRNLELANYLIEPNETPADQKAIMKMWNSFVCSNDAINIPYNEKRVAVMVAHFIKLNKKCILGGGLKFPTLLFLMNNILYKCLTIENLYSIWKREFGDK
jgi:hypothetical protein